MTPADFKRLPNWLATLTVVGLIAAIGVVRFGVTIEVSYTIAPILRVESVPGRSFDRMATVEVGEETRILRTRDRKIETTPGKMACLETRSRLFRAGHRHALALPFYCRKALAARGQGAYL